MQQPPIKGAGADKTSSGCGGKDDKIILGVGPDRNRDRLRAMRIDRAADIALFLGLHSCAERLSHQAHEMRRGAE
jgi:hypothetical protein